jgi:glutamine amidotransferase
VIAIVDYGCGNLGSLSNMLDYLGAQVKITSDPEVISKAPRVLLPGVGSFDVAASKIDGVDGLRECLLEVGEGKAGLLLAICLGMQLLGKSSDEGQKQGLGIFDYEVQRFPVSQGLKVPHVGWGAVNHEPGGPPSELGTLGRFYFSHSYYVPSQGKPFEFGFSGHGVEFVSVVKHGNVLGAQFHPEKSHRFGREFLKNFLEL